MKEVIDMKASFRVRRLKRTIWGLDEKKNKGETLRNEKKRDVK